MRVVDRAERYVTNLKTIYLLPMSNTSLKNLGMCVKTTSKQHVRVSGGGGVCVNRQSTDQVEHVFIFTLERPRAVKCCNAL